MLCEIDAEVVNVCKKFFPTVSARIDDPRVELFIGDGIDFVSKQKNAFDMVLIDSTDPIGPGEGLFTSTFYKNVATALRPGGLAAAQTESPWGRKSMLQRIFNNMKSGFNSVQPYCAPIPTYPRGLWSWSLASQEPLDTRKLDEARLGRIKSDLNYLTSSSIRNAFDLPNFYKKKLGL